MEHRSDSLSEVHSSVPIDSTPKGWRRLLAFLGPAYLVSVGYMDPGNWATDLAGGSAFGYSLIWVLLMSNLMALLLQNMSARLGVVRGLDLAQASRNAFPSFINIPLYVLAEIAIIACDLAEIIGMAIGLQLLTGLPLIWGVCVTALDSLLLLFFLNKGIRIIESFIVSLVVVIGFSFLLEMFIVKPQVMEIAAGFKPSILTGKALYIAIGIIGATVMPHNLYLHSSLVQTRQVGRNNKSIKEALRFNLFDTAIALNLAFLVNASILILAATAFYKNGYFEVAEIQHAFTLLERIFGSVAPICFAVALIAAGQSSTITGTLAGQIVMEGYLNLRIRPWIRRLLTRSLAIVPALCTIIFLGENFLGSLLVLSQVVLSLQLGFAIIPLIHFVSDKKWMKDFVIKRRTKILAWIVAGIIIALNVKLVIEQITQWVGEAGEYVMLFYFLVIPIVVLLGVLLIYMLMFPFLKWRKNKAESNVPHGLATLIEDVPEHKYERIGVAIDFSSNDASTIQQALFQGGKSARYLLIHIVESAGAQFLGAKILDHETRSDRVNLEKYVAELEEKGYHAEAEIGFGNPARAIPPIAEKHHIQLLVMGAHGHKGIKDLIFGQTVDSVRHAVRIPVFIVRNKN